MSSFQGFSIGIGITYPLCGFLIANFGWRSVFYTTGSIGELAVFWICRSNLLSLICLVLLNVYNGDYYRFTFVIN